MEVIFCAYNNVYFFFLITLTQIISIRVKIAAKIIGAMICEPTVYSNDLLLLEFIIAQMGNWRVFYDFNYSGNHSDLY